MEKAAQADIVTTPFEFSGSGGEYFRIWIVNLILTVLTLGIYSAWAKVRRNRYFYGHTRLGVAAFEYLADPKAILKGRLLAVGVFLIYAGATQMLPWTAPVFGLLFLAATPWLVINGLKFRMRNTAFRNVRFDFIANYREAVRVFIGLPLLIVFTLGLIVPYLVYRQNAFIVGHTAFGQTRFAFKGTARDFYRLFGELLFALLAGVGVLLVLGAVAKPLAFIGIPLLYFGLIAYAIAQIGNMVYNRARLAGNGFRSDLRARDLFTLYLTNAIAIVLTLGLFIPWAAVRMARYRAGHLSFLARGDLDQFLNRQQASIGSAGEEMGEMFDVEVAI